MVEWEAWGGCELVMAALGLWVYVMYAFITERWCVCVYCREASAWTVGDVELVGRLLFTLSPKQINSIPLVRTPMGETQSAFSMSITLSWVMTIKALQYCM
jgi:hypothetical protein